MAKDFVLCFSGISGSGKSTLAEMLCEYLRKQGRVCFHVDGEVLRQDIANLFGYTREERMKNNHVVRVLGKHLSDCHIATVISIIAPYKAMREEMRAYWGERYIEVFVDCPTAVCAERDVKGYYAKVRQGKMKNLNGVNDAYERPGHSEIVVHTDQETKEESLANIVAYLEAHQYV